MHTWRYGLSRLLQIPLPLSSADEGHIRYRLLYYIVVLYLKVRPHEVCTYAVTTYGVERH